MRVQGFKCREEFCRLHHRGQDSAEVETGDEKVGKWTIGLIQEVMPIVYRDIQSLKYPPEEAGSEKQQEISPTSTGENGLSVSHHYEGINEENIAKPEWKETIVIERVNA